jgi:peptidoglycan/LPS O-acetylase OafA/YrhL
MSATHPVFAIGALTISLLTAWFVARLSPPPPPKRYDSLDGLRGLLAMLVMISHASGWRLYAMTGEWTVPPSRLYTHFGQSSVALFFMITAFLFGSKLLESGERPVDWLRLYVSRALRIMPLYFSFVAALVVVSIVSSGLALHESLPRFGLEVAHWLAFTFGDMPAINQFPAQIVGGATWSLPYEWWFYLALPLIGILLGRQRQPAWLVVASAVATAMACAWITSRGGWSNAVAFLGGGLAAILVRERRARVVGRHPASAVLAVAALFAATLTAPGALRSTMLLTVAFVVIASGNTLFGFLISTPLRTLGAMSYSVYLLHGLVLYLAFSALGKGVAGHLTPVQHWLVAWGCVPVVVGLCHLTFRVIEAPAMAAVNTATGRVRAIATDAPVNTATARR